MPPVKREDIVAYVGRFDITNWTEQNSQPRKLSKIFIHPDFDSESLHSDLAVLKFNKPIDFSNRVGPACLWRGNDNLSAVVDKNGIVSNAIRLFIGIRKVLIISNYLTGLFFFFFVFQVFGWGTDGSGNKISPTPKLAVMPIVSQEECLRSKIEFLFLTTNRTFCAGFRNGE